MEPLIELILVIAGVLIALDGVGLPAEMPEVLDAEGHRADVRTALGAGLFRQPPSR
jgi:hypothetical protein